MSTAMIFDTLTYSKKLKAVGFTNEQAEVQAQALLEIMQDGLATKYDLQEVENKLRNDIQACRNELKADIQELRNETKQDISHLELKMAELKIQMIQWFVGISVAQGAMVFSLIKFVH